jgi:subtilisin-like proprotein convertase family protein
MSTFTPPPSTHPSFQRWTLVACAWMLGPSALGLIEIHPEPAEPTFSLRDTPRHRLRLSDAWSPPSSEFWTTQDGSIRVERLPQLGDLVERFFSTLAVDIPDSSAVGVTSEKTVQGLSGTLTSVEVQLNLAPRNGQPMFNGDLLVTLSHGSGYAVLLNRTGRRAGSSAGYGDSGFNITLSDQATADIHNYRVTATGSHTTPLSLTDDPAALTGTWQPDGRSADPSQVLDSSPRDAMLSSFVGLDPNGTWTLHVSDLSENGEGRLTDWTLVLTTVPEPGETLLVVALGLGLFAAAKRRSLNR